MFKKRDPRFRSKVFVLCHVEVEYMGLERRRELHGPSLRIRRSEEGTQEIFRWDEAKQAEPVLR